MLIVILRQKVLQDGRKCTPNSTLIPFYHIYYVLAHFSAFLNYEICNFRTNSELLVANLALLKIRWPVHVVVNFQFQFKNDVNYPSLFTMNTQLLINFKLKYYKYYKYYNYHDPTSRLSPSHWTSIGKIYLFKFEAYCTRPFINRIRSIIEITLSLNMSGIEPNPGPPNDESYESGDFEILTINCNGLTSNFRLLQAIGKIKKYLKNRNAIRK